MIQNYLETWTRLCVSSWPLPGLICPTWLFLCASYLILQYKYLVLWVCSTIIVLDFPYLIVVVDLWVSSCIHHKRIYGRYYDDTVMWKSPANNFHCVESFKQWCSLCFQWSSPMLAGTFQVLKEGWILDVILWISAPFHLDK